MTTFKLGPELKEGDIIKFWVNGNRGMTITKLRPYTGRYPDIVCGIANLEGTRHVGEACSLETSIEHHMRYEILKERNDA